MRNYSVLSDIEFEAISADLLTHEWGNSYERFSRGPDGGVDLRATLPGGLEVVQCKHYLKSRFDQLLSQLKKEVDKVANIDPATYRVVTSMELSRGQKDQILELFSYWMPDASYVTSGTDIDSLLTRHQTVEKRYVKLWLDSGGQLEALLRGGQLARSKFLQETILEAVPRFVEGRAFGRALDLADKERVCIIAGPPGIGKTTLAQVVVARFLIQGYEVIEVSGDIEEAWDALNPREKQIFYYDDFLGRVSFGEKFSKNEDQRLSRFIGQVNRSQSKLLVMTTREYVLEEARQNYEELQRLDGRLKLVLELQDYSRVDRAKILYNHLWHSELEEAELESLLIDQSYMKIIDHPNFTPRLIQYITSPGLLNG